MSRSTPDLIIDTDLITNDTEDYVRDNIFNLGIGSVLKYVHGEIEIESVLQFIEEAKEVGDPIAVSPVAAGSRLFMLYGDSCLVITTASDYQP